MILGKLAKTGALVASGILIGGLLSYNSEKTKIINGIDYLKNTAIEAKNEVSQVTAQRDKLKEDLEKVKSELEEKKEKVEELTDERDSYKNRVSELEEQLKNTVSKEDSDELKNEIKRLNQTIRDLETELSDLRNEMTELEKTLQTSQSEINRLNDLIALKDKLYTQTYMKAMEYEDKIEELKEALKVKEATISMLEQELE